MPCPHYKINIVKRSGGNAAISAAAYQSGEKLFSEYDKKPKATPRAGEKAVRTGSTERPGAAYQGGTGAEAPAAPTPKQQDMEL